MESSENYCIESHTFLFFTWSHICLLVMAGKTVFQLQDKLTSNHHSPQFIAQIKDD